MYEEWSATVGNYGAQTMFTGNMVFDEDGSSYVYYRYPNSWQSYKLAKYDNNGLLSIRLDSVPPSQFADRMNGLYYYKGHIYYLNHYGIIKYDKNLNVVWNHIDTFTFFDGFGKLAFDNNDNIIVSWANSHANDYYNLIKVNNNGTLAWKRPQGPYEYIYGNDTYAIVDASNSIICSYRWKAPGFQNYETFNRIVKFSSSGNILWETFIHSENAINTAYLRIRPNGEIWAVTTGDVGVVDTLHVIEPLSGYITNTTTAIPNIPFLSVDNANYFLQGNGGNNFTVLKKDTNGITLHSKYFNTVFYNTIHYGKGYLYVVGRPFTAQNQIHVFKLDTALNLIQTFVHSYNLNSYGVWTRSAIDSANRIWFFSWSWGYSAEIYRTCQTCKPNISGTVYYELNQSCAIDSNENKISNRLVEVTPGPAYAFTNNNGNFGLLRHGGTYTIRPLTPLYWQNACYDSLVITLDSLHPGSAGNLFGSYALPNIHDKRISIAVGEASIGFDQYVRVEYSNVGTTVDSGIVAVKIDSAFSYVGATPSPDSSFSNTFFWKYDSLQIGEARPIMITVHPVASINYPFTHSCLIEPISIDTTPTNNYDTVADFVLSSYDPNDKSCTVKNSTTDGFITDSSDMIYLIRFQNTGTDTAINILVVDTLDNALDISSFQMLQSSHNYELSFLNDRTLKWTFANILLPDSHANMILSNGFIKYSIKPKKNLAMGSAVSNSASIYFDFNVPIKTNTTINYYEIYLTIKDVNQVTQRVLIYPNPFSTFAYVNLDNTNHTSTQLIAYDLAGRQIWEKSFSTTANLVIERAALSSGLYLLEVKQDGKRIGFSKFVIE